MRIKMRYSEISVPQKIILNYHSVFEMTNPAPAVKEESSFLKKRSKRLLCVRRFHDRGPNA